MLAALLFSGKAQASSSDIDQDALEDAWEIRYFGSIENGHPLADDDADGLSNLFEQQLGTNPVVAEAERCPAPVPPTVCSLSSGTACVPQRAPSGFRPATQGGSEFHYGQRRTAHPGVRLSARGFVFVGACRDVGFWLQVASDSF